MKKFGKVRVKIFGSWKDFYDDKVKVEYVSDFSDVHQRRTFAAQSKAALAAGEIVITGSEVEYQKDKKAWIEAVERLH